MKHRYGKDVGQEEMEKSGKMDGSKGVRRALVAKIGVLNYTHLHAFTRIYTHLHAFTRFYTLFLSGNVTKGGNGVPE